MTNVLKKCGEIHEKSAANECFISMIKPVFEMENRCLNCQINLPLRLLNSNVAIIYYPLSLEDGMVYCFTTGFVEIKIMNTRGDEFNLIMG